MMTIFPKCDGNSSLNSIVARLLQEMEQRHSPLRLAELANTNSISVVELVQLLQDANPRLRLAAAITAASFVRSVVVGLCQSLRDEAPEVRREVVGLLSTIFEKMVDASKNLAESLNDPSPGVGIVAAAALGHLGTIVETAIVETVVPALDAAVPNEDAEVRKSAISALGNFGRAARPALSNLVQAIQDKDSEVSMSAIGVLNRLTASASYDSRDLW